MIRNKNIANAGWIIGCKMIQALLGVLISMLTARYLGPSQFGVINYAAALVAFVAPVAKLGLTHVVVQEVVYSPDEEGEIVGSSIGMSMLSSIFCMIGIAAFSVVANPNDRETILVCALYSILLIANALEFVQYWFQAKLMSKYPSIVAVIIYILISIYKAVLLYLKMDIYWFAVSNAVDHMAIGIVLLFIYRRCGGHRLKFSLAWAKKLFAKSKFFIVSGMMITIFSQTDKIMLKFMMGDAEIGFYSAASACAGMTSFVFAAIIDSMRPTVVACKKKADPSYELNMCRLYAIIISLAFAQSLFMTLLAKPIVFILYGRDYLSAVSVLSIIVWQTTFSYIGSVRNVWILAEEKQRYLWIINLSGAIMNVALNLILIPRWGATGAAVASVITQMFSNFVIGFLVKPIRYNNTLMIRSLHPKILIGMLKAAFK